MNPRGYPEKHGEVSEQAAWRRESSGSGSVCPTT